MDEDTGLNPAALLRRPEFDSLSIRHINLLQYRMIIAIVGCRHYEDYNFFCQKVDFFLSKQKDISIISGGATGADAMAERYAKERGIPFQVYEADWDSFGKSAGPKRNMVMAKACDGCLAFMAKGSKGTKHMVAQCIILGKKTKVVNI